MKRFILVIGIAAALSGCAVQKELIPTGGSRADGTVELAYEFGMFEKPQVDHSQGLALATKRCQSWGYSDAELFGGVKSQCAAMNGYGCERTLVTIQYACIGASKPQ